MVTKGRGGWKAKGAQTASPIPHWPHGRGSAGPRLALQSPSPHLWSSSSPRNYRAEIKARQRCWRPPPSPELPPLLSHAGSSAVPRSLAGASTAIGRCPSTAPLRRHTAFRSRHGDEAWDETEIANKSGKVNKQEK